MKYPFLIALFFGFSLVAQQSQIRFDHLDTGDGLSHNRINAIYEDELGFMWFGTSSGLNRYDGTEVIQPDPNDSIPGNLRRANIVWLKKGLEGNMWIRTGDGVLAYNTRLEKMVDIRQILARLQINNINLSEVKEDTHGDFWFAVSGVGLMKYLPAVDSVISFGKKYQDITTIKLDGHDNLVSTHMSGRIEKLNTETGETIDIITLPKSMAGFDDLELFIDSDGDYWLYSVRNAFGAYYLNMRNGESRFLTEKVFGSLLVSTILQDDLGSIIIGQDHNGLFILNKKDWSIHNYLNIPSDPKSLSHNTSVSAFKDSNGLIWMGTNKAGVNYYNPKAVHFNYYKQINETNPNANDIIPIVEDKMGNLWLGSDGGGLVFLDRKTGAFSNFTHDLKDPTSLSSNIIVSMVQAGDSGLWIGTYLGGLNYFNFKTRRFKTFLNDPEDPMSIADNSIWKLYQDKSGHLWVGTHKGGVDVFDGRFKKVLHLGVDNGKINSNYITAFSEDKLGRMWIGTGYGLNMYDRASENSISFLKSDGTEGLSDNSITDLYEDSQGRIWISTMNGLNLFDPIQGKFKVFTKADGLPESIVVSVIEDNTGQMWFGTYKGISNLRKEGGAYAFRNFDASDGLQGDMFNERSVLKTRKGELVFGGKNGINIFDPSSINMVNSGAKLVFLNFYLSNNRISPGQQVDDKVWFEHGLNDTDKIDLDYDENSITIEFASLNYNQDRNKVYRYRLKGFDNTWVTTNIRRASFTNLDPGTYTFQVMTANKMGVWNDEGISMTISIAPPFWKTPWAYFTYVILIVLALFVTRRAIIQRERFRAKIQHERLESSRLHELDLMKIKFFTNISHEFRTPLTLILTPVERLLRATKSSEQNPDFLIIQRNARRLLSMVNQLLDFRKMESNQHKLSKSSGDLVEFIRSIVDSFFDLSKEKQIKLHYIPKTEEFLTTFDRDKMEKIMFNLLSNAFKFTPQKGIIEVSLELVPGYGAHSIRINVSDTGIGIPDDKKDEVFKRFFQLESKDDELNLNHGSGIGLSITREFVQMHGGEITLTSKIGEGSVFSLFFPFERLESIGGSFNLENDTFSLPDFPEVNEVFNPNKKTLFLVEDNSDFRFYLRDNLKDAFNVSEAANGKAAWKKMVTNPPDLIITDIMMPVMNGIELCKKVKSDPRTAHIPVILLTAHYSDEQKIEGLQAGAIEYLTKPFNFEILISSIHTSLKFQELIHVSDKLIQVSPLEIEITSLDETLIQKSLALVEENMSNSDFSVQDMSYELGVSRGQLYKKILHITGQTPIEFIRTIRLKRAAHLLAKSQLTVAEVAYKVGFNNPKYFARYFKEMFHELPSKFAQKAIAESIEEAKA